MDKEAFGMRFLYTFLGMRFWYAQLDRRSDELALFYFINKDGQAGCPVLPVEYRTRRIAPGS